MMIHRLDKVRQEEEEEEAAEAEDLHGSKLRHNPPFLVLKVLVKNH